MKKHIVGLALFSFIVSAAAVVFAFFNVPEIVPVAEVNYAPAPHYVPSGTSCRMKSIPKRKSIEIKQAVLDLQTKQFNWELAAPDGEEMIELHFFLNDGSGARYITSERINSKFSHNGVLRFSNSYSWLNKRQSFENIYVIARFESASTNYSENFETRGNRFEPKFDAAKATPVTVDYGD